MCGWDKSARSHRQLPRCLRPARREREEESERQREIDREGEKERGGRREGGREGGSLRERERGRKGGRTARLHLARRLPAAAGDCSSAGRLQRPGDCPAEARADRGHAGDVMRAGA